MSKETGGKQIPTARRLRAVRRMEGYDLSNAFARYLGVEPSRLSNMENGSPLSIQMAIKIRAKTGVTLDWLYHEDERGLSVEIRDRLRAQLVAEENGTTTSSRSSSSKSRGA